MPRGTSEPIPLTGSVASFALVVAPERASSLPGCFVAKPLSCAKALGDHRSKHRYPAPDRFVGNVDAAFGQQFFDVSEAQREAEIEPDSVLDDLGWEAVAGVR